MITLTVLLVGWILLFCYIIVKTIIRKVNAHKKPLLTCFLDTVCEIPMSIKIGSWGKSNDIYNAIKCAMDTTGLSDLGGYDHGVNMTKRYDIVRQVGIAKSGVRYSPLGYHITNEVLTRRMITRLQFINYLKLHPSITKLPIQSPIFIIGFPRTGTTFLHELLGLHHDVRMHYSWEQMDPVPKTSSESMADLSADRRKRYTANKSKFDMLLTLAGDSIQSIHRIGYDEPEECTTPCALELPWGILELPLNVFAAKEIIALGAGDTFKFYRRFLQMLAWQSEDRCNTPFTWMLKCPFHLPYLDELHETFPDATIVWTHRDPIECIASACSLYETLLCTAFETTTVNKHTLGAAVVEYSRLALEKAFKSIKKYKSSMKILHVHYRETVKSPQDICRKVITTSNLVYTSKYDTCINEYLQRNMAERKAKKGNNSKLHEYSLQEYGLTDEGVRAIFDQYINDYC